MKIKKVRFKTPAFRMFSNMEIDIADRLTVIAGHNGIGKSTLLGLIANGSELKPNYGKTILGKPFQAQLHELFYLDEEKDYVSSRGNKPMFELEYHDDELDNLIKTCNVSKHTERGKTRLKVVPRGSQLGWNTGESAKVTIPTLFLSMSRMLPLGETKELLKEDFAKLMEEDRKYIHDKFKAIVSSHLKSNENIIRHEIKTTTKRSLLPEFEHSAKAISLGQDSLSSIITALASFNKLKREFPDYKGGILLIDEIDAGFHPRVQVKLIDLLKKEAKKLRLQIIMTSHSLIVIEEVLKITDDLAKNGYDVDSVIYLEDVFRPSLMSQPSFEKIKRDMMGELPSNEDNRQKLKIYFEDEEAVWFCKSILAAESLDIDSYGNFNPIYIGAKLGWDNLRSLYHEDDYFKNVLIILDNDVLSNEIGENFINNYDTVLALPAVYNDDTSPDERTLEFQIYNYLEILVSDPSHRIWDNKPDGYNIENIKDMILDSFPKDNYGSCKPREVRKKWFNSNKQHFENLNLIKYFCEDNHSIIIPFINELKTGIDILIKQNNAQNSNHSKTN